MHSQMLRTKRRRPTPPEPPLRRMLIVRCQETITAPDLDVPAVIARSLLQDNG